MKKELRKKMLVCLKEQDRCVKNEKDRLLMEQLLASAAYQEAQTIATYLSMGMEVDTSLLLEQAQKDGKRLLVPKVLPDHQMAFYLYEEAQLQKSSFGILEPVAGREIKKETIDLIHVPGLAWNESGYRIGFGGGYYDRYLADYTGRTISTIYEFQRQEFEADAFDIAVEEVLYV
ncbi:5-formyltetrahydrofolate cyclo-ligase [Streptococcus cameli]